MTDIDDEPAATQDLAASVRAVRAHHARRLGADAAADLAHDASVHLLIRPPPDGRVGPWLERIARNLAVDGWRSRERGLRRAARLSREPEAAVASPEDVVLAKERRRAVRRSLRRLPRDMRRSILVRFFVGLDAAAAGTAAGISAVTVRTRLHRALARLRRMLAGVTAIVPGAGSWVRFAPMVANTAVVAGLVLAVQEPVHPNASAVGVAPASERAHAKAGHVLLARAPVTRAPVPTPGPRRADGRSSVPSSQPPAAPPPAPSRLDFDADEVTGEIDHPDVNPVIGDPRGPRHPSLIEIPDSFAASLAKTIEDL